MYDSYHKLSFCNNTITDSRAPEGVDFLHGRDDSDDIAIVENNVFYFYSVSSNLNVYFGKFRINGNYFGPCRGSAINAIGYDSEICRNVIKGSYASSGIDISEEYAFKYSSHDIIIRNNVSDYCQEGFFSANMVSNIVLSGNVFNAEKVPVEQFKIYDKDKGIKVNDYILHLEGENSGVVLENNVMRGDKYLWSAGTRKNKSGVTESKNRVFLKNRAGY